MDASRSTASGKVTPSVIMTKSKIEPFLPEEKSNQACFWSLTKNDGVFSRLNGDSPFHSRPAFFSLTRRPTTSETGSRALSSSRKLGEKRMLSRVLWDSPEYRHERAEGREGWDCPGYSSYPQGGDAHGGTYSPASSCSKLAGQVPGGPFCRPTSLSCAASMSAARPRSPWPGCARCSQSSALPTPGRCS